MFITFEGGEGSGKTTQISKLADALKRRGLEVVSTREPGGTRLGEHIRECLLSTEFEEAIGIRAELMLFLASRVQHLEEVIHPALSAGKIVICDRFNDSSAAYQGGGRGLGVDEVLKLCSLACGGIKPDLTFFLDIDPDKGMDRLNRERDRLESAGTDFHQKVREAFLTIARRDPGRVRLVDASQEIDTVFSQILKDVEASLANR